MINKSREYINHTRENGKFMDRATVEWKDLLESTEGFRPIRNIQTKRNTAVLLENQWRHLNEAANNSSMLGPMNGLTGGQIGNVDGYATGDFRVPRIVLPMVRRIYPNLIANEVVGVQPMISPVGLAFAIRYEYAKGPLNRGDNGTQHFHGTDAKAMPEGHRGVFTKATIDKEAGKLIVILDNGYPKAQPLAFAEPVTNETTGAEEYVGVVSPLVQQIKGAVEGATKTTTTYETAAEAIEAAHGLITEVEGVLTVGISMPEVDNPHLTAGNNEMGYQRLDTRFTGRADERLAKPLAGGRWQFRPEDWGVAAMLQQFEDTGAVARTRFGFKKVSVEAGTRRIGTSWSLEIEEDLKNTNGIDIESHATQQMTYEMQAEIDREMTVRMLHAALSNNEWSVWDGQVADARWLGERNRAFYQNIIKQSGRMQVRNRRGPANFIICTPDVAALLESLDEFTTMPTDTTVSTANLATAKIGTLNGNRFSVYVDSRTPVYGSSDYGAGYDNMFDAAGDGSKLPNYCMLGYKGSDNSDAGIIYCPYIPIMIQHAVDPYSFAPQVGLSTRYGCVSHIFGSHLFYHVILIDSFSQPGINGDNKNLYPAGNVGAAAPDSHTFAYPVEQK